MPDKYLTRIEMIRYVLRWLDLAGQAELETKSTSYVDDYMISESDKGYINTAKSTILFPVILIIRSDHTEI